MASIDSNNQVIIKGTIIDDFRLIEDNKRAFYETQVSIPRLSGENDVIVVNFPEYMIKNKGIGSMISILGQFRSKNVIVDSKSKLELTVYALSELDPDSVEEKMSNIIMLSGFVCKNPIVRLTPFGREIADILLAVNRGHKKSDYLPLIAWSTNAKVAGSLTVGDQVSIIGRIQSRKYNKKLPSGEIVSKIAYEVSITKLCTQNNQNNDGDRLKDYFGAILENVMVKYAKSV